MEFGCSICEYTSIYKQSIIRHINKKKSCGSGLREIIEIPIEISCEYCGKNFSTYQHLVIHVKNNCRLKDKIRDQEIKKLKEEIKTLKRNQKSPYNNVTNNVTNVTNNIIIVNNYDKTRINHLTDKDYNKLLKEEIHKIIPSLIKQIHFDPELPENHNVFITNRNKNNKFIQILQNEHWESVNKNIEIDNIIYDKETNIEDWISEKGEKYPRAVERFNEYKDQKHEPDTAKLIKEEVELVLYNNRYMIKN